MAFKFRDHSVLLDIEGNEFKSDASALTLRIAEGESILNRAVSELAENPTSDKIDGFVVEFKRLFAKILGKSGFEKVSNGKKLDYYDCIDLFEYIASALKEWSEERYPA